MAKQKPKKARVFTDPRDGKQYKTVKIGEQVWMAENLNWEGTGCWYNNSPILGNTFGRLYTWDEALKAVPPGWHLPTDDEWQKLVDFAGGGRIAGGKLRAKDGWDGNGTDDFGFSALPGGYNNLTTIQQQYISNRYSFLDRYGAVWERGLHNI